MVGVHVVTAMLAILSGSILLACAKGTASHRRIGWVFSIAAVLMALSSFGIYQLRNGPSVFHAVSVALLVVLAVGLAQPLRRRQTPHWRYWHAVLMPTALLMIVVTGLVQFFDRLPLPNDALNAIVFLQLPGIVGFVLIVRFARRYQPTRLRSEPGSSGQT